MVSYPLDSQPTTAWLWLWSVGDGLLLQKGSYPPLLDFIRFMTMYERREVVRNVVQREIEVENNSEGRLVGEEVITGAEQSGPTTPWYSPLLSGCCGYVPLHPYHQSSDLGRG